MKKSLPKLLSVIAVLALAGCGHATDTPDTGTKVSESGGSTTEAKITVTDVKITDSDGNTITSAISVFDGSTYSLKALVTADGGTKKVDWSSSDTKVASVTNGTVKFLNVTEQKSVTVTATSKDDKTKSATVTFNVFHSLVDLKNSKGNDLDTSLYMDDGTISFTNGDSAVLLSDVHGTKWYVQADIKMTEFGDDKYPKFGIMSGNKQGDWNTTTETSQTYNNFFYVDAMASSVATGWNSFNVVCQNEALTDWDWNTQLGAVKSDFNVKTDEAYTMGMLRDGQDYYLFLGQAGENETDFKPTCVKHVVDKHIAEDMETYAWFGGWSTGAELSNIKALTGDAVDSMYATPTNLSLTYDSDNIYIGKTYQIEPKLDVINYDRNKLTFTSSDPTIATVDKNGLVTASSENTGEVTITVTYGDLKAEFKGNVTDDLTLFIELDGKMDDAAWNEKVKANKYRLTLANDQYIDYFVTRNAKGVYIFADGYFTSIKGNNANADWWENENWECRFMDETGTTYSSSANDGAQVWISGNKTANFDGYYITDETKGEGESFYNIKFEVYQSYETMNAGRTANLASETSTMKIWVGSNPVTGWKSSDNLVFTKDGFVL